MLRGEGIVKYNFRPRFIHPAQTHRGGPAFNTGLSERVGPHSGPLLHVGGAFPSLTRGAPCPNAEQCPGSANWRNSAANCALAKVVLGG